MQAIAKTDQELAAWLRLAITPGLRPAALRRLLADFGLPDAVLGQPVDALARSTDAITAHAVLSAPGTHFDAHLEALLAWRSAPGNALLALDDPAYPPM